MLELYSAFRAHRQFQPETTCSPNIGGRQPAAAAPAVGDRAAAESDDPRDIGSNNWVVAGSRTQSTFPILANDPHRTIAAPSLRYWVHLVAPGWNVIGGGEPVLPGVSIGHNEHGAWGLTIFGNDNEDLYVYETNPANANEYRYHGRWEAMRVVNDTIPVKGETAAIGRAEIHAAWSGHLRGPREPPRLRGARGVDRAGRSPVPRQPANGSGDQLGGVSRSVHVTTVCPRRTWSGPIAVAPSAGKRPASSLYVETGAGCCPCQVTGATSGMAYLPITALPHEVNPGRAVHRDRQPLLLPE